MAICCFLGNSAQAQRGPSAGGGEQRVALVIGNAAYQSSPLRNPVNDARAMADKLSRLGFVVIRRENLKAREVGGALREFRSRLSAGATALFFYAGHGVQVKGVNYLPAVDAELEAEEDVPMQSLNLSQVLDIMDETKAKVSLVFLDACRDNPFARRFRSAARGLAKVDAASGTLISFATRPGSVASDGDGQNGLYTEHLLKNMDEPGVPIEQLLKRVGAGVKLASKGRQEPWSEGLIEGDFFFRAGAAANVATTRPQAADPAAIELAFWSSIQASNNAADFEEYLRQFPDGRFAGLSRNRIADLRRAAQAQVALAQPTVTRPATASPSPGASTPADVAAGAARKLKAQDTYPTKDPRHGAFLDVLRDIEASSGGALAFEALPAGAVSPAWAVTDAISKRQLSAAWISAAYLYGRDPAFGLIEGAPFGLDSASYVAWRNSRDVAELVDRMFRAQGVVGILCGVTGPHGDIWVRKPIARPDDLKGLKIRAIGLGINLFSRAGAAVNALPGGEIVPAMDRNLVDAAVFSDPRADLVLGFPDVSRVYMVAQLYGSRGLELAINAELWDGLPAAAREAVVKSCRANVNKMIVEGPRAATEAVQEMMKNNVKLYKLPESVLAVLRKAWVDTRAEHAAKSPNFAALAASMTRFEAAGPRPDLAAYGLNRTAQPPSGK